MPIKAYEVMIIVAGFCHVPLCHVPLSHCILLFVHLAVRKMGSIPGGYDLQAQTVKK